MTPEFLALIANPNAIAAGRTHLLRPNPHERIVIVLGHHDGIPILVESFSDPADQQLTERAVPSNSQNGMTYALESTTDWYSP